MRSSGGALTSGETTHTAEAPQVEPQAATPQSSTPATTLAAPAEAIAVPVTPTTEATSTAAADLAVAATAPAKSDPAVRRPKQVVVPKISEISSLTTPLGIGGGAPASVVEQSTSAEAVGVKAMAAQPISTNSDADTSTQPSLQTFTGVLAAVLAPFVAPLPGGPVDQPVLWAVFAWARRQSDRNTLDERFMSMPVPRQTEKVVADKDADPPGAIVDGIDRVTGTVTGRVNLVGGDGGGGITYVLGEQVDRRLGAVTVDAATGQWAFTPRQGARLAAQLSGDGATATFSVLASDGRTVDVRAPVDPVEAAVTGTVKVGDGLTYGLAVVGDRLYVLNGSDDAAGNGFVKIVDTSTKRVIGSIEVGSMPFALAVSGRSLYVGNADDGTVSVVDVAANRVVKVIDVGAHPFGLEVTGDRLYVADQAGTVSVIDVNDNQELVRIPIDGDPFGVAATADRVYVTNYAGGTVAVVDQATNTAAVSTDPPEQAGYPYFAAVVGGRLYVVNSATNALTIVDRSITTLVEVDPHTRAVDAIPSGAAPVDMVVRGDRLYVSNINSGTVAVIDVATNQPVESIAVGIQPGLMTATPDGRTIYVADTMGGAVRVITSVRHVADA